LRLAFRIPGRIQSAFLEIQIARAPYADKSLVNQGWRGNASLASTLQYVTRGQPPGRDKKNSKETADVQIPHLVSLIPPFRPVAARRSKSAAIGLTYCRHPK
jgi:hypothetical protein